MVARKPQVGSVAEVAHSTWLFCAVFSLTAMCTFNQVRNTDRHFFVKKEVGGKKVAVLPSFAGLRSSRPIYYC